MMKESECFGKAFLCALTFSKRPHDRKTIPYTGLYGCAEVHDVVVGRRSKRLVRSVELAGVCAKAAPLFPIRRRTAAQTN